MFVIIFSHLYCGLFLLHQLCFPVRRSGRGSWWGGSDRRLRGRWWYGRRCKGTLGIDRIVRVGHRMANGARKYIYLYLNKQTTESPPRRMQNTSMNKPHTTIHNPLTKLGAWESTRPARAPGTETLDTARACANMGCIEVVETGGGGGGRGWTKVARALAGAAASGLRGATLPVGASAKAPEVTARANAVGGGGGTRMGGGGGAATADIGMTGAGGGGIRDDGRLGFFTAARRGIAGGGGTGTSTIWTATGEGALASRSFFSSIARRQAGTPSQRASLARSSARINCCFCHSSSRRF